MPHLYLLICWTFRLLLYLGYCRQWILGYMYRFGTYFFGYMPRSWISGSYGISLFSFLRILCTVLHSGSTNFQSHSVGGFPFFHTLSRIYFFIVLLMMAILTSVKWYFIVVLICISLMIGNVEHLFMCLLAICISYLANVYAVFLTVFKSYF